MELSATIHLVGDLLGQVIGEQESPAVFDTEERIRSLAKARRAGVGSAGEALAAEIAIFPPVMARSVASAFALYFDLVNLAEEVFRVQALRERERELDPAPIDESIASAIASLNECGVSVEAMAALLGDLHIELVLTAHPTEAKRRTILSKLRRISESLHELNRPDVLPREHAALLAGLRAEITALWLTERARSTQPEVADEIRTGLYFVDAIFWEAMPRIYADLEAAISEHYPGLKTKNGWLSLASWIGGDRDGNPNVTVAVTAEALRLHRGLAVEHHRRSLQDLARRLSVSVHRVPPSPDLRAWLDQHRPLPAHAAFLERRYVSEPYRLVLSILAAELEDASQEDMAQRLLEATPYRGRAQVDEFTRALDLVSLAMPRALVQDRLLTVERQFEIFGLHSARLDIREDSSRLKSALGEILRGLSLHPEFERDDVARRHVLIDLLSKSDARPAGLAANPGVTAATVETWALFQLIARSRDIYGDELLGAFIISMTRGAADVLTVLLMSRWACCADGMEIVPLFETVDDLDAAPQILADLFSLEVYRSHLATCDDQQMVMIGYSDSNKEDGYLAANWALYQAQERIAEVCRAYGIKLTLFHGRGGSVARGGGPANRAIRAQPPGTVNGRFRVTEQGETIASRYADLDLAHRHLEQIVNAVLLASAPITSRDGNTEAVLTHWRETMGAMCDRARGEYRALVHTTPGFMDFWRAATPIDEISRLHIGSRPATRGGGQLQIQDIRAIPWVFSWMQSRFNLPGWYGLGMAMVSGAGKARLQEMYASWPFFRALMDNAEMSLLKADMGIAALYSDLVPDRALAAALFTRIREEFERTRDAILGVTDHRELMDADPIIQRSVQLRNPYVDPLNYIQVEMLRRLRSLADPEGDEAQALREVIFVTINGIAAGLRNTG